jgi:hypothetical protein
MHQEVKKVMKQSRHILFLVTLVLLACFAPGPLAQERERRIIQGPVRRSTPIIQEKQSPPLVEGHANSEIKGDAKQRDPSIFGMRRTPQPPNSIRVEIRYNKEYGYKDNSSAFGRTGPQSFDAFAVDANPYGSRRPEKLIPITINSRMIEVGGYYVCDYLISELPLDQAITVSVSLANRYAPTERWHGGSQPQPPPGQQRLILEPTRSVTLTRRKSRATLVFEMVYAPQPAQR